MCRTEAEIAIERGHTASAQWDVSLPSAFARDEHDFSVQVDVGQLQADEFLRAHTGIEQGSDQGSVTPLGETFARAGFEQPPHLVEREYIGCLDRDLRRMHL